MKVKKVGTGKSSKAYLTADKPTHPMQCDQPGIHHLKRRKSRTDMLTALEYHYFPAPVPFSLLASPRISSFHYHPDPVPLETKPAGFLLLLFMAFSQSRQHLRPYHNKQTLPSKELPP